MMEAHVTHPLRGQHCCTLWGTLHCTPNRSSWMLPLLPSNAPREKQRGTGRKGAPGSSDPSGGSLHPDPWAGRCLCSLLREVGERLCGWMGMAVRARVGRPRWASFWLNRLMPSKDSTAV